MKDRYRNRVALAAIVLVVAVATALVFSPVIRHGFLRWDDDIEITTNSHIHTWTAENLKWMLTDTSQTMRYIPLSWMNWAALISVGGLSSSTFHLEALVIHTLNAVLVLFLSLRLLVLTGAAADVGTGAYLSSGMAALAWAVHPLRTEVVAWATQERFAQSLLFFLVAILAYLRYATEKSGALRRVFYGVSLLFGALAALSYPTGALLFGILIILDLYPLRRIGVRHVYLEKIPFLIISALVWLMTLGSRLSMNASYEPPPSLAQFGLLQRLAQALYICAYYVWRPLFPVHLAPVYRRLMMVIPSEPIYSVSLALVAGLTVLSIVWVRRRPGFIALWVSHVFLLAPMMGFFEHPHHANDRYSYTQGILWSLLLGTGLCRLTRVASALVVKLVYGLAAGTIILLAIASYRQTSLWADSVSLFEGTIRCLGNDRIRPDLHSRLGMAYLERGEQNDFDRAFEELRTYPMPPYAAAPAGWKFLENRQPERADVIFRRALEDVSSGDMRTQASLHNGLGVSLARRGLFEEAQEHFTWCVRAFPDYAEARSNLGQCLMARHRYREAVEEFKVLVRISNGDPHAVQFLNEALARAGES